MSADLEQKARDEWNSLTPDPLRPVVKAMTIENCTVVDQAATKFAVDFTRSVVSDIVGRLEARIATLKKLAMRATREEDFGVCDDMAAELERQVAELKKEYGIEP